MGFYTGTADKPESLSLWIGPSSQGDATVRENETLTLTCEASARPVATLVLEKEDEGRLNISQSPLVHRVGAAQCEDAGRYRCSASNILGQSTVNVTRTVFVMCSPRSTHNDLGVVYFRNQSTVVTFLVTAYPAPSRFVFNYTGPNGTDPATEVKNVDMSASCFVGSKVNQFTCHLAVLYVRSWQGAGFYTVAVSNTEGHMLLTLQLLYSDPQNVDPNSQQQCPSCQQGAITGLAVALGLVLLAGIVVLVCLGRRGWVCPWSDQRLKSSTDTPISRIPTVSKQKSNTTSIHDNEPGPYDSLRMSEVGQRSPYTEIQHGDSVHRPLNEDGAYDNASCEQNVTSS